MKSNILKSNMLNNINHCILLMMIVNLWDIVYNFEDILDWPNGY